MVNATFIECRNISECNDVFCKSLVRSAMKLFEVEVFVPLFKLWSKPVSESTSFRESFGMQIFYWNHSRQVYKSQFYSMRTSTRDWINVKINISVCDNLKSIFRAQPNLTIVEFHEGFLPHKYIVLTFLLTNGDVTQVLLRKIFPLVLKKDTVDLFSISTATDLVNSSWL